MVFLRSPFGADAVGPLEAGPLTLRIPAMQDYEAWSSLRLQSRAFLQAWEPSWPHDDLTKSAFRGRIKRYHRDIEADTAYPFFIFRHEDGALVGALTLSNVRRGVAQMASLGYWIGAPHQRQGHMTRAVSAATAYAFTQQHLHRIEAACLPANAASIALLRTCGFTEEGYARQYLKIAGKWQDHLLFGLLATDGV